VTEREHEGLRIALAFTGALVAAEGLDVELSFLAPLVAGMVTIHRTRTLLLLLLPVIAWMLALLCAVLAEIGTQLPLPLALVLLGGFWFGFRLSRGAATASAGLILLVSLSVLPDSFARLPDSVDQVTRWMMANAAIASAVVLAVSWLLPARSLEPPAISFDPPLPDGTAALALLAVVLGVWAVEPASPVPLLVSVIVLLRAEGGLAASRTDRLVGALAGGALALAATLLTELSPSLPMLAMATLLCCWPIALAAAAGGRWRGAGEKALIAMAVLHGQGLSDFYEDTDERFGMRLFSVLVGLAIGAVLVALLRRRPVDMGAPASVMDSPQPR